jgi:hypothetical protein
MTELNRDFGKFIKSRIDGKIVEISGERSRGLLRDVVEYFGENVLFILTVRGYERGIKETLRDSIVYVVSERYFELRQNIDVKDMMKLVKQIVNELVMEMRESGMENVVLYRANDLPPIIPGSDLNRVEEEFWRSLTIDLRSLEGKFMFVYEKMDYKPDILSYFADNIIIMTHPPQIWSVLR